MKSVGKDDRELAFPLNNLAELLRAQVALFPEEKGVHDQAHRGDMKKPDHCMRRQSRFYEKHLAMRIRTLPRA